VTADSRNHYSYTHYADPATARTFDDRRFGGPVGELVASTQARVLANFIGRIHGRTILDVGTGTGRAALLLARGGARVVGIDASEEMLAVARRRAADEGTAVTFQSGDAHALQFPDRSFEIAVSLRVLMHTPEWRTCIAELCRVADRAVIVDYPSRRSAAFLQSITRKAAHAMGRRTEPYTAFADAEIAAALSEHGFRVLSTHRLFVLPIVLHKAIGSRGVTLRIESVLERLGLLKLFGSPVTIVAERCARS
jgi:ubiquinone/menaquinone biosynthesis C-methylase UbiE